MTQSNNVTTHNKIHTNLSASELVNLALSRKEGVLAANQALNVTTGLRTGRSPKDRFIVKDAVTDKTVDWNTINQAFSPEKFATLWQRAEDYLQSKECAFVSYLKVGADDAL